MKNKLTKLLTLFAIICLSLCAFTACSHEHSYTTSVTAPTCTEKGFTTYTCECGETYIDNYVEELGHDFTDYVSDNNANYDSDGTKTATCNRDNCSATDTVTDDGTKLISHIEFKTLDLENKNIFANNVGEFSFLEEIETFGYSKFNVASDKYGKEEYLTKIVPLNFGDNTFYVFESIDGDIVNTYTVVLRRRPMYNVYFDACGGTEVEIQTVEEDGFATLPAETIEKAGYTFDGWDFDFATPITQDITVNAKWTANYYTLSHSGAGSITNTGTYRYGAQAITSVASLGYDVVWKSGEKVLSTESEYSFTATQNVIAETSIKNEMQIFNFTSTPTTCEITGLKDKTQTSITIPNYVTSIGNHAFYDCDSLTSIEIPDSVISIGDYAFAYCNLLTNVEIRRSIINIGEDSFIGCSKLTIHCETERKRSGWSNDWNSSRPVVWGTIKVYTVSFSLTPTIREKDRECVLVNNGSISLGEGQSLEEYSIELLEGETLAEKGITKLPIVDPIEDSGIADGNGGDYSFGGYWKYSNVKNGDTRLYKVEPDTVFNAKNFPGVAEDGVIIILPHCRAHWIPGY